MADVWIIVSAVLGILILERVSVITLTRSTKGREWVRAHWILHPNTISFVRMPMGIVSVVFWANGWHVLSIIWFAFWMISDLSDGTIARNCDLATEMGKWLDPLSDKCMYFPPLVLFMLKPLNWFPVIWVIALIIIDIAGQFSRLLIKKKAANYFGKAKTALITIMLATAALNHVGELEFITPRLLFLVTISCTILAFLSVYCKLIPDVWYANSLTLCNFICGLTAIWYVADGLFLRAFVFVFVGQFFDLFDGRMARRFGSTRYGAFFDDIADGTSFGVAIAFLVYKALGGTQIAATIAFIYLACVVFRLYRFIKPKEGMMAGIFEGLPSPAGAMLAGSAAMLFSGPTYLPVGYCLVLGAAVLMVSRVPYRHFGQKIWPALPNSVKLLSFVLSLVFVNVSIAIKITGAFSRFCFVMIGIYVVLGANYRLWGDDRTKETEETPQDELEI